MVIRVDEDLTNTPERLIALGRCVVGQDLHLPVDDKGNFVVAVNVRAHNGYGGASDPDIRRSQPLPDYLTIPPSDKPKFAAAEVAMDAPFDPAETPGVRHFVRQKVRRRGGYGRKNADFGSITLSLGCRVKVMLYH
jgi:hypothetical protein